MNIEFNQVNIYKKKFKEQKFVQFFIKYFGKPLHFISSVLSWTIFVLLIVVACFLIYYFIAAQIYARNGAGYEPKISLYTIISPSMVPNINVYDVVIVNRIDNPADIKVGDIISFNSRDFRPGETISVTHRVVEVLTDSAGNYSYQTKGDNNFIKDPNPVKYESVMGRVDLKIPQLGRLQFFLASATGWMLIVVIPALFVIIKSIIKIIKLSEVGKKIPKNSKLFPIFNTPLKLTYKEKNDYIEEKNISDIVIDLTSIGETIKEDVNLKSLDDIYEDLKKISE